MINKKYISQTLALGLLFLLYINFTNASAAPTIQGCAVFPPDSIWNTQIENLPTDPNSNSYVNTIGAEAYVHADFGSGTWAGGPIGIPYVTVAGSQPTVAVSFDYADESDPGPYPIPPNALIEGGPSGDGDRHVLVVDYDNCMLYELFYAFPNQDGSWSAGSGAIFDLQSHALRPDGWTSADAAGLPVLPGLVRYDEVQAGEINHALRFTAPQTQKAYTWPATHDASSLTGTQYPPMGQRFRLKADFDVSGFSPEIQVILNCLKKYGMMLADNGSSWYISGAPDERWNNDALRELHQVPGSAFEAVDVSSLMVGPDSGQARSAHNEAWYQDIWCAQHNGETGITLDDGTRADCVTDTHIIEFDFADKWYQSVAQSLHYSMHYSAARKPGIVLIIEDPVKGEKYWQRLNALADNFGLPIDTWSYDGHAPGQFIERPNPSLPSLKSDLSIHMPILRFNDPTGSIDIWADFEYAGQSGSDFIWKLTGAGVE